MWSVEDGYMDFDVGILIEPTGNMYKHNKTGCKISKYNLKIGQKEQY